MTRYPWEGMAGLVLQAALFDRAGYPAYSIQDRAPLRAMLFLDRLRREFGDQWWDGGDWTKWVINRAYGVDLPVDDRGERGKNMAWTDWMYAPAATG